LVLASFLMAAPTRNHGARAPIFATARPVVLPTAMLLLIYVHAQALYKYAIPFYFTNAYVDTTHKRFKPIPYTDTGKLELTRLEIVEKKDNVVKYRVTGVDPHLTFKNVDIDLNPQLILIRIHVENSYPDYYKFYWDAGAPMSEATAVKGFMPYGESTVYQILPVSSVDHLRFDLGMPNTTFAIKDLSYAPLKYKPFVRVLNTLFDVKPTEDTL